MPPVEVEPYTDFAFVYDNLLKYIDYERWYKYIRAVMRKFTAEQNLILELGCGTGRLSAQFSRDNFSIIGVDRSFSMLKVARSMADRNYHIICADIVNFQLKKKPDFIFCVHDTVNYLTDKKEIVKMLGCVKKNMHENSIFLFDITTEQNIYDNFHGKETRYSVKNTQVSWTNEYHPKEQLVYSYLTFKKNGRASMETHIQRIYDTDEITNILAREGFNLRHIFSDHTFQKPHEKTRHVNFIVELI